MSINVTVVGSTGVTTSIASSDQIVVAVGGTALASTPLPALQVTAGANITITTTSGVYTFIGPHVPVNSVNGKTGTVVLTLANLTAAAASHTHVMANITDLVFPVNTVNGKTGTVVLTSTDVSAASASHTHVAANITNLTAVANVVSVNGQTGVAVLNSTNVSAASAVHTHVMANITDLAFPVNTVNGKTGTVVLTSTDVSAAGAVHSHVMADITDLAFPVSSVNGKTGTVSLTITDLTAAAASHTHVAANITNLTAVANVVSVNGITGTPAIIGGVGVTVSTSGSSITIEAAAGGTASAASLSDAVPQALGSPTAGTSGLASRSDHAHAMPSASDVGAAALGHTHTVSEITDLTSAANVVSVNGYTGTVSLTTADITAAAASHTHTRSSITDLTSSDIVFSPHRVLFSNVYSQLADLPSATDNHGMFAHVHATGRAYYAHAGSWVPLANQNDVSVTAVNGRTGSVSLTVADLTAASAAHTHKASEITDLTSVANVVSVNGQTGVVTITASGGGTAATVSTKSLSGSQNNYDAGSGDIIRLTPSSDATLTGLAGGVDGVVRVLYNVGTHAVTLAAGSTNSVETNRFSIVSGDVSLGEGDSSSVWYDGTSQRWRVLEDQVASKSSVASINGITGAITIAAGDNVTVSTSSSTITIAAASGGGSGGGIAMSYLFG